MQRIIAKSQLEQLDVVDLLIDIVVGQGQQLVAQQRPVLVEEKVRTANVCVSHMYVCIYIYIYVHVYVYVT